MIANDQQYSVTWKWVWEFDRAAAVARAHYAARERVHPLLEQAHIDSLDGTRDELQAQLDAYAADLQPLQRLLVSESDQHLLSEGYNWVGSYLLIDGFTTDGDVLVHQFGYAFAGSMLLSREDALRMRRNFLDHCCQSQ